MVMLYGFFTVGMVKSLGDHVETRRPTARKQLQAGHLLGQLNLMYLSKFTQYYDIDSIVVFASCWYSA